MSMMLNPFYRWGWLASGCINAHAERIEVNEQVIKESSYMVN